MPTLPSHSTVRPRGHHARLALVIVFAAAGAGCAADDAVAPRTPPAVAAGRGAGPLHDVTALASGPILLAQVATEGHGTGMIGRTTAADDFVVPAGESWPVASLVLGGVLAAQDSTATFAIRADSAGVPGAGVPGGSLTMAPTRRALDLDPTTQRFGISNHEFQLPAPVILPPGRYWLTVVVRDGRGVHFNWQAIAPSVNNGSLYADTVRGTWVVDRSYDYSFALVAPSDPVAQTITFPALGPATVGGGARLGATAPSTLPITYGTQTPAVCTVAGDSVAFVGGGACTVTADQAGGSRFLAAPQATQTVAVARLTQAVAFTSTPPSPALVGGTYAVTATGGGSGQPVAFSSLTPAVCTAAGSTVTFAAAGDCTIAADQAGTAAYDPAPRHTQVVAVTAPVPPAPAFPRTPVLDRFGRADGALGSGWGGFAAPAFFRVQGGQGAVALGGGIGWAATAFGPTQEAFVTFTSLGGGTSASTQGLVLKGQDPRDHTLGALTVTYDPRAGAVRVGALRSRPTAVTAYPALAVRFAVGDQLGARATAAGAVEVYRNGARVGTVTLNAADQAYFAARGGYVGLLYVAAPGARFDDFGGGTAAP